MAPILMDTGCCPVCGDLVKRAIARDAGGRREVYRCPKDGAIEYGPQPLSIARWAERFVERAAPATAVPLLG